MRRSRVVICIVLCLSDEELPTMHAVGDGEETAEQPYEDITRGVGLCILVVGEHFCTAIEEEHAEDGEYPLEARDDGSTEEDEDAAQDEGSDDSPEQHLVLVLAFYAEEREQHEEHEEVVDGERLLDEVAGEELQRLLVRVDGVEEVDACAEQQRHDNPDDGHVQGFADAHLVLSLAPERLQVDGKHEKHHCVEKYPAQKGYQF